MKSFVTIIAACLATSVSYAQNWAVDKAHAKVGFTVTHLMLSEVDGSFKTYDARLTASKPDLSDAVVEFSADVNSISTDNDRRDGHLKSPDFFDAAKYPTLTFRSKSFQRVEGKKYKLTGDLTMHGVTKPVTLDAILTGPVTMDSPRGKQEKAGLKISGMLKRSDFGVGSSSTAVVSDEVELKAAGEFARQEPTAAEKDVKK